MIAPVTKAGAHADAVRTTGTVIVLAEHPAWIARRAPSRHAPQPIPSPAAPATRKRRPRGGVFLGGVMLALSLAALPILSLVWLAFIGFIGVATLVSDLARKSLYPGTRAPLGALHPGAAG